MADTYYLSGPTRVVRGPPGAPGTAGTTGATGPTGPVGSGSIEPVTNLIQGDGAGAGVDSTIVSADVIALVANNTGTNTGDQTDISGNAATVTTNANLTGNVTSVGNATTLVTVPTTTAFTENLTGIPTNQGGWLEYWVAASQSTASLSLVDIPGLISGTLAASARYEIEATLLFVPTADTGGLRIGIHAGGSGAEGACFVLITATANTPTTGVTLSLVQIDTPSTVIGSGTALKAVARITGFVTTRSSGTPTISIQHLKTLTGTSSCNAGSVMRLRRAHA